MAKKKVVSKKKFSASGTVPTFDDLTFAAALMDYRRIQAEIIGEIQRGRGKTAKCSKCGKTTPRNQVTDYVCSKCPNDVYVDEATGLPARTNAGCFTTRFQRDRLAAARDRCYEFRARVLAQ